MQVKKCSDGVVFCGTLAVYENLSGEKLKFPHMIFTLSMQLEMHKEKEGKACLLKQEPEHATFLKKL